MSEEKEEALRALIDKCIADVSPLKEKYDTDMAALGGEEWNADMAARDEKYDADVAQLRDKFIADMAAIRENAGGKARHE